MAQGTNQSSSKMNAYMIVMIWLSMYWSIFVTLEVYRVIVPTTSLRVVEAAIVIFFVVDYIQGLIRSTDKHEYFKQNILALLSIIPPLAILRVGWLGHQNGSWKKIKNGVKSLMRTNQFGLLLLIMAMFVFFSTIALYHIERGKSLNTYFEAFYNVILTIATVGYGDFAPVTFGGRVVAIILSIFSIAFIGIVTGTLANYFFARVSAKQTRAEQKSILELGNLTQKQKHDIADYIRYVKDRDSAEPSGKSAIFSEPDDELLAAESADEQEKN